VASTPSGARIIVDGTPTGFRTPTAFPLAAGGHRVMLTLSGHRNWEGSLQLSPGETVRIDTALEALGTGSLSIWSIPAGAAVSIDGLPAGALTPALIRPLSVGTHTVQLRREGYDVWTEAVVIHQGQTLQAQAVLAPSQRNRGALVVQSQPPGAAIVLDGVPAGVSTPASFAALLAGSHRVELALEGFRIWSGSAVVREGQREQLLVTLRRLSAQEVGGARIESEPPGAALTLNGILLRRKTPASFERLAPGTFPIEISRPGSRTWRGELSVLPGRQTVLSVRLDPATFRGGSLRVDSDPPGAVVLVDGEEAARRTPTLLPDLSPAGHRIEVVLPGYRPWVQMVHVSEGTLRIVRARLVPRPYVISAAAAGADNGGVAVRFIARSADGGPAGGSLEVSATRAVLQSECRVALADGSAGVLLLPAPDAVEVPLSVVLGTQRETFLLRRGPGGWEIGAQEE